MWFLHRNKIQILIKYILEFYFANTVNLLDRLSFLRSYRICSNLTTHIRHFANNALSKIDFFIILTHILRNVVIIVTSSYMWYVKYVFVGVVCYRILTNATWSQKQLPHLVWKYNSFSGIKKMKNMVSEWWYIWYVFVSGYKPSLFIHWSKKIWLTVYVDSS